MCIYIYTYAGVYIYTYIINIFEMYINIYLHTYLFYIFVFNPLSLHTWIVNSHFQIYRNIYIYYTYIMPSHLSVRIYIYIYLRTSWPRTNILNFLQQFHVNLWWNNSQIWSPKCRQILAKCPPYFVSNSQRLERFVSNPSQWSWIKPNLDCNYPFPMDLVTNGIAFGAQSIGKG